MSVNSALGLPPYLYTDPRIFERERTTVFREGWLAVARSDALPAPGSYLTVDRFGDPIVVTRRDDGTAAAFSNVCLHRSCTIAGGQGTARGGVLSCPYHRWTYDLDGRLCGTPHMERAVDFDKREQRLPALAAEEWLGWIFVNADPAAQALSPQLAPLERALAPFDITHMKVFHTLEFPSAWNWKVMVDNFLESYHHIGAHTTTLQPFYPAAGTFVERLDGPFVLLENPSVEPSVGSLWVACVYPCMLFAITRGERPLVTWYDMRIRSHDRFDLSIRLLGDASFAADASAAEEIAGIVRAIHLEDIRMCEGVWRGLHSTYAHPGRLSHLEDSTWRFHEYLRSKIGA